MIPLYITAMKLCFSFFGSYVIQGPYGQNIRRGTPPLPSITSYARELSAEIFFRMMSIEKTSLINWVIY